MGHYTGLRANLIIRPEFVPVIEMLMDPATFGNNTWGKVAEAFPQYTWLAEWSKVGRADFIPFGSLCVGWKDDDPEWERSFVDRRWVFQCSLKNYQEEIETFAKLVLARIVEEVDLLYTQDEALGQEVEDLKLELIQ